MQFVQYCIYYMFRLLNCHCNWHGFGHEMYGNAIQYMLTWPILFYFLICFCLALPYVITVQFQYMKSVM